MNNGRTQDECVRAFSIIMHLRSMNMSEYLGGNLDLCNGFGDEDDVFGYKRGPKAVVLGWRLVWAFWER